VELTLEPARARVIPFDRVPTDDDRVCTADISPRPHPIRLYFTAPGTAAIVAEGMVYRETGERARGTVSKSVTVVP
jgi:hypothetical protein